MERARAILPTALYGLPNGDALVTWRDLNHSLLVTAYRDGRLEWRVSSDTAGAYQAGDAGPRLLARALDMARGAMGTFLTCPTGLPADSVPFQIDPVQPLEGRPTGGALQVPIFTVGVPEEEPARLITQPALRYPKAPRGASAEGTVLLQFVVDTAGRVDLSTVREMPLANVPRVTGVDAEYHRAFVAAVEAGLANAKNSPARLGGCVVRQQVVQPFEFKNRG